MGMYVYRVTKDRIVIDGKDCHIAVYAYKPTYHGQQVGEKYLSADQINAKMAFKTGCMSKTNIHTDYIVTLSSDKKEAAVYCNPNKYRTFYDDSTLGTDRMPYYNSYSNNNGVWEKEQQYA